MDAANVTISHSKDPATGNRTRQYTCTGCGAFVTEEIPLAEMRRMTSAELTQRAEAGLADAGARLAQVTHGPKCGAVPKKE